MTIDLDWISFGLGAGFAVLGMFAMIGFVSLRV